ncbi:MAG: argininosuccinate lyase [Lachnospiraceae bacterium]|nr:argininosuccinate lyase [Lachnospiraceae bacterium]
MATLWGGRFTKETDALVKEFNDSLPYDRRLFECDVEGSLVHAEMLAKQGIISEADGTAIHEGLISIRDDVRAGRLEIGGGYEDIHSFVEAVLTDRIGEAGKRLHTGRSRNDQVALDMRLFARGEMEEVRGELLQLLHIILEKMKEHEDTTMPGFTHLQKAQPVTLGHHLGAYFEMFSRDVTRLEDNIKRMNYCPLGSGALAGTTYPLDRDYTAQALGFDGPTRNSMDGVSDRDYELEFLSALSIIMMHLSRLAEETIIWNTNEYRFIELDDAYSTGSSIMPQKKNPDIAELVRGKTGRVYGALMSMLTTMKALPLAYDKDMQEDKEVFFDALDTAHHCIILTGKMLETAKFNKSRMADSAGGGFTNATDAADYLVTKGVPFRDAHGVIGQIVLYCIENNKALTDLSLDEFRKFSPAFDEDVFSAIDLKTCVDRRLTTGAPGHAAMEAEIAASGKFLEDRK